MCAAMKVILVFSVPCLSFSEFVGLDLVFSLETLSLKGEKHYSVFLPQPNKGMVQTESSC